MGVMFTAHYVHAVFAPHSRLRPSHDGVLISGRGQNLLIASSPHPQRPPGSPTTSLPMLSNFKDALVLICLLAVTVDALQSQSVGDLMKRERRVFNRKRNLPPAKRDVPVQTITARSALLDDFRDLGWLTSLYLAPHRSLG